MLTPRRGSTGEQLLPPDSPWQRILIVTGILQWLHLRLGLLLPVRLLPEASMMSAGGCQQIQSSGSSS